MPNATITKLPTRGIPSPVSTREKWDAPEPNDRQVWAVCPYLRNRDFKRCMGCPAWEDDPEYGRMKRGCRALAEETCRAVEATRKESRDA